MIINFEILKYIKSIFKILKYYVFLMLEQHQIIY